ncbi:MAG TPA: chemotaxis protein CheW [Chthoniobacteraceae bacterium]|nr:chemotaxis protein CheW [Chthoniobacteraceae bacterium]
MNPPEPINWSAVHERLRQSEAKLKEVFSPAPEAFRTILRERAARLALRKEQAGPAEKRLQLLVARSGGEQIALDLGGLAEILPLRHLTAVPGAPAYLLGVTPVRGEFYNVLDPGAYLHHAVAEASKEKAALGAVLRHPRLRVVLGLEAVLRIESVTAEALAHAQEGVLRIGDDVMLVIDLQALLARLEDEVLEKRPL